MAQPNLRQNNVCRNWNCYFNVWAISVPKNNLDLLKNYLEVFAQKHTESSPAFIEAHVQIDNLVKWHPLGQKNSKLSANKGLIIDGSV